MTLSTDLISEIRAAVNSSPLATTVTLAIKTNDTWGSNQTIDCTVSSYKRSQIYNETRRSQEIARAILVRPMETPSGTVRLGDRVTYNSELYVIVEIQNTAIAGWVCERTERVAVTRGESFRAEGGGE